MSKKIILSILVTIAIVAMWFTMRVEETPSSSVGPSASSFPSRNERKTIDRISLTRHRHDHGAFREETTVIEKTDDNTWQMISPNRSKVNSALVRDILLAIENLSPKPIAAAKASGDLDKWALENPHGIEVIAYAKTKQILAMVVGLSKNNTTYLRMADQTTVLTTPGHLRKVFDRGPSQLRYRRITDFEKGAITRMTFHNKGKALTIVKIPGDTPQYRPDGEVIKNFDVERAIHRADALSKLYAKDFYDKPHRFSDDALQVTLEVRQNSIIKKVVLTFGEKEPHSGLHFAASSLSDQVFLLSPHMKSLFAVTASDFEMTDEQVKQRKAWQAKIADHVKQHHHHHPSLDEQKPGSDNHQVLTDTHFEDHIE